MAERQTKRRRSSEDADMTVVLAQPASEKTHEICGLSVHADLADNNFVEEGLMDENEREKTENGNAGGLATTSVRKAANLEGWQPGRADHGLYEIVTRSAARGKFVRVKWFDDWGRNGMRSRLVAQQFDWAKRDDVTQNTPPLVLVSKAASFGHKIGREARCLAAWDCSVAFHHAPLDEDIVVVPPKG